MRCPNVLCLFFVFAYGCGGNNIQAKLLSEQKLLKDSANHIRESVGNYVAKNQYDSVDPAKVRLEAVQMRLIAIQASLDSLAGVK